MHGKSPLDVHFVSLFSEGPPQDLGADLTEGAISLHRSAEPHFKTTNFFTPHALIQEDQSWAERFKDYSDTIRTHPEFSPELKWNEQWARTGLFSWKPRLILEFLESPLVEDGALVFYHDSDSVKYPEYLLHVDKWASWIRKKLRAADVLVFRDNSALLVSDTKRELWEKFFSSEQAHRLSHVWAGAFAVRKTAAGRQFVRWWDSLVQEAHNLLPVTKFPRAPGFVQHSNEQAVLACLRHYREGWPKGLRLQEAFLENSRIIAPPATTVFDRLLRNTNFAR